MLISYFIYLFCFLDDMFQNPRFRRSAHLIRYLNRNGSVTFDLYINRGVTEFPFLFSSLFNFKRLWLLARLLQYDGAADVLLYITIVQSYTQKDKTRRRQCKMSPVCKIELSQCEIYLGSCLFAKPAKNSARWWQYRQVVLVVKLWLNVAEWIATICQNLFQEDKNFRKKTEILL